MINRHLPVMLAEALGHLDIRPGGVYVDGTLGGGGHAAAICRAAGPAGLLIGIDRDPAAVRLAAEALAPFGARVRIERGDFARMESILGALGMREVDGILLDLGISTNQLEASGRGFSFQAEEPLDMSMDPDAEGTASELVNRAPETELKRIFAEFGEERHAGRIARRIVAARRRAPIETSAELARIVAAAVAGGRRRIHPATRVFMALRIAVNRELERLEAFFDALPDLLKPGGRVCVIAFHSLEDRIVKHRLRALEGEGGRRGHGPLRVLTRKVVRPSPEEIAANPLARSARLRAAERI